MRSTDIFVTRDPVDKWNNGDDGREPGHCFATAGRGRGSMRMWKDCRSWRQQRGFINLHLAGRLVINLPGKRAAPPLPHPAAFGRMHGDLDRATDFAGPLGLRMAS